MEVDNKGFDKNARDLAQKKVIGQWGYRGSLFALSFTVPAVQIKRCEYVRAKVRETI